MKTKILNWKWMLLFFALATTSSLAGQEGGGGVVVVCKEESGTTVRLLDLFEAENLPGFKGKQHIARNELPVSQQVENAMTRLHQYPELQERVRAEIANYELHAKPLDFNYRFVLTGDIDAFIIPENCELKNVVVYQDAEQIWYKEELIALLPPTDQAALKLHEALYKIHRDLGNQNGSKTTRMLVGLLFLAEDTNSAPTEALDGIIRLGGTNDGGFLPMHPAGTGCFRKGLLQNFHGYERKMRFNVYTYSGEVHEFNVEKRSLPESQWITSSATELAGLTLQELVGAKGVELRFTFPYPTKPGKDVYSEMRVVFPDFFDIGGGYGSVTHGAHESIPCEQSPNGCFEVKIRIHAKQYPDYLRGIRR